MWEGRPLQWVFAEEANGIGMQLAKEILGGKYEPVLTTHIDKGHIYNHLICAPIRGRVNPLSKRQA